MPVLQAWKSERVIVMKRGMSSGYAEVRTLHAPKLCLIWLQVPNPMFGYSNTRMLFGDALGTVEAINSTLKSSSA